MCGAGAWSSLPVPVLGDRAQQWPRATTFSHTRDWRRRIRAGLSCPGRLHAGHLGSSGGSWLTGGLGWMTLDGSILGAWWGRLGSTGPSLQP